MTEHSRGQRDDTGSSYWYAEHDSATAMLTALRAFRQASHDLRRRMSAGMEMNTTDLAALRHVIAHEASEDPVTALGLAEHLGISGASTSKLLDRLTASGHLQRVPHPRDWRSRVIHATDHAHTQVRERLSGMHERMLEIAEQVPESARPHVSAFLQRMTAQLDAESAPPELTPRPDDDAARRPAPRRAGTAGRRGR